MLNNKKYFLFVDEFNIYTREAGEGTLSIGVEGPGKADINLVEQASGFWVAGYTVTDAGKGSRSFSSNSVRSGL